VIGRSDRLSLEKTRKITFGSTISESFAVGKQLDERFLNNVAEFWREKNLSIKNKTLARPSQGETVIGTLVVEGGTIWTIDFDLYRKKVSVSMVGADETVEVFAHMELIGGFMSARDKQRAMDIFQAFLDRLSQ